MKAKINEIVCPNCGGAFSIEEPKCPFCGTMNPHGAEKEYMEKLYDIREDTDMLDDFVAEDLSENVKAGGKRAIKVAAVALMIIFAFIIASVLLRDPMDRRAVEGFRAREEFKSAHFDELNTLYEEEKYDELVTAVSELFNEPGYDAIYSWEHYTFYDAYHSYAILKTYEEEIKQSGDMDAYISAVYYAFAMKEDIYVFEGSKLTSRDRELIKEYKAYSQAFLEETLDMTTEEVDKLFIELKGSKGYLTRNDVKKVLKEVL